MTELRSVELQLYRSAMLLRPVLDRIVFVGGVVRGLLVTDAAVEGPRATDDVDTIIEISTLLQYQAFESELRHLGFKNDMRDDAPVCRYVHHSRGISGFLHRKKMGVVLGSGKR